MSKAFTKESDDSPDESVLPRPSLPPGVTNYITPEGAQHLQAQLAALVEQKRAVLDETSAPDPTRSGDIRRLEGQIRQMQSILNSVVVTQPAAKDSERVAFGSTVTTRQANGAEITYRIVGVEETDFERGLISWRSPLARALLSKRPGDEVRFVSPTGIQILRILSVRP